MLHYPGSAVRAALGDCGIIARCDRVGAAADSAGFGGGKTDYTMGDIMVIEVKKLGERLDKHPAS